jgi:L-ascorbate metabolism protein UlaG (beta-lactamase superfamily)
VTGVPDVRITHIGGPTVLLEVGGWRLLTDPTFDPPGRRYTFGWGSSSRKLTGPAVAAQVTATPCRHGPRSAAPSSAT